MIRSIVLFVQWRVERRDTVREVMALWIYMDSPWAPGRSKITARRGRGDEGGPTEVRSGKDRERIHFHLTSTSVLLIYCIIPLSNVATGWTPKSDDRSPSLSLRFLATAPCKDMRGPFPETLVSPCPCPSPLSMSVQRDATRSLGTLNLLSKDTGERACRILCMDPNSGE